MTRSFLLRGLFGPHAVNVITTADSLKPDDSAMSTELLCAASRLRVHFDSGVLREHETRAHWIRGVEVVALLLQIRYVWSLHVRHPSSWQLTTSDRRAFSASSA